MCIKKNDASISFQNNLMFDCCGVYNDGRPIYCSIDFEKREKNNCSVNDEKIQHAYNFKYYVVTFVDKPIFDQNGNNTTLHNPIYVSKDEKKWIMGSAFGHHENGVEYVKNMNGIENIVGTNIYRKILEIVPDEESFIQRVKTCDYKKRRERIEKIFQEYL